MAGTAPDRTGPPVFIPQSLPSPASFVRHDPYPPSPKSSPRPIVQGAAHLVAFMHPVPSGWTPPHHHQTALALTSSERLQEAPPSHPPMVGMVYLPALSLPRLAPGGQQGPGRELFGSCRPCGAGHGSICGQWSLGVSSTPNPGYERCPHPPPQPCEVALLWIWRPRLREGKGQAQGHSGARAGACWCLPARPLTDAHNTDVSPHNLAALQHDLLQLWGGGG